MFSDLAMVLYLSILLMSLQTEVPVASDSRRFINLGLSARMKHVRRFFRVRDFYSSSTHDLQLTLLVYLPVADVKMEEQMLSP